MSKGRIIKYKVDKDGNYKTRCPNGLTTFVKNAPKVVGYHCLFCKFRIHVDYDKKEVRCSYVRKKNKE